MHAPLTEVQTASRTSPPTMQTQANWSLRNALTAMFGVDVRSLAAFRIAMGGLLLLNLWNRLQDFTAHYTDDGVMPRTARISLFQWAGQDGGHYLWSLHLLNGSAWSQAILFLVQAMFAVWLLIGYRTRLATFASWLLLVSLHGRNPILQDGGDGLWEAMLFWSLFVPLGAAFSVDRRLRPPTEPPPQRILSLGATVMQLQLCLMYLASAIFKLHPMWSQDFTAIYYVMNLDIFTTRLGHVLSTYPEVMKMLTCATVWLEFIGPWLAFMPVWNGRFRMLAVFLFWGLHLGFVATMELGMFPWICMACWLPFVPGGAWDALAKIRFGRDQLSRLQAAISPYINPRLFRSPERPRCQLSWVGGALTTVLFGVVVWWNVREIDPENVKDAISHSRVNTLVRALGLDQRWNLFAPDPMRGDGWWEMEGTLRDGSLVNLWQIGEPLPTTKPDLVSSLYVNQRWRKYLLVLSMKNNTVQKPYFADWLRRRWDEQVAGDDANRKVSKIRLIYHMEYTPPPGEPLPDSEDTIWIWRDPLVPDPTLEDIPPPELPTDAMPADKPATEDKPSTAEK